MNKSFTYGHADAVAGRPENAFFYADADYAAGYAQGQSKNKNKKYVVTKKK